MHQGATGIARDRRAFSSLRGLDLPPASVLVGVGIDGLVMAAERVPVGLIVPVQVDVRCADQAVHTQTPER